MNVFAKSDGLSRNVPIFRIRLSVETYLGLLLGSCLVLTQCSSVTKAKPPKAAGNSRDASVTDLMTDEYAVYNAVIEAKHRQRPGSAAALVVISNRTVIYTLSSKTLDETLKWASNRTSGGIPPELVEDLKRQNQQEGEIPDFFNLNISHVVVSKEEVDKIMKEGQWELFYQKFPKSQGIVNLSRVGFDAGKTQALVYFGNPTSATSGGGGYILLEKTGGAWSIKHEIPMWVI